MSRFLEYEDQIMKYADGLCVNGESELGVQHLQKLGLDSWGALLWSLPNSSFPGLSKSLPKMPEISVQRRFNGASGSELLQRSLPFVRYLVSIIGMSELSRASVC